MMKWNNMLSDRSKAFLIAGLTAAFMLLAAGLSLAVFDSENYKAQKLREVTVEAEILAASVTAPLVFEDAEATREYLNAFLVNPETESAAVYDQAGNRVAFFTREDTNEAPARPPGEGYTFDAGTLAVVVPAMQDKLRVGTVYIRATTEPLIRRVARYGGILMLVTLASLAVAVMVFAQNALSRANTQLQTRAAQLAESYDKLRVEIGEREKAENALRQAQKMEAVGQLTGGIAHDFNNMLAVVVGNLSLLLRRAAQGKTDLTRYAEGALEGAKRGALLTQQLLAFSRQQPLAPVPLDANNLVSGMSELLRRSLGDHIRLETVIAGGLWTIHADKTQLETAILNLAVNARDAMPEGGRLTIETANTSITPHMTGPEDIPAGEYVIISVSDSGTGMAPEIVAKVFDPFFTTKPVGQGTGLGLSQVYGFLKQSRGHVKIDTALGRGTTVKLYLPRHMGLARGDAAHIDNHASPTGSPEELLLVVEDDANVRRVAVDSLRELGYTVLQAGGAAEAFAVLDEHPDISLLFTDIVMPDGNGRKLADDALRANPKMKVLFTTGYTRDAIVHDGALDDDVELLSKPYAIEQLALKVRAVLDAPTSK
jgi:signal transduction histidine kinase/ActR/RegA family two-component response regulator